jgi:hypothetical protein
VQDNLSILISKLDEFIRKYYKNLLLRGTLLSLSLIFGFFLVAVLIDQAVDLSSIGRTVLFFGFLLALLFSISIWVIDPLIRFYRLGKVISYEQAARIVGEHFSGVGDKVVNTLQLGRQAEISGTQLDLLNASIRQRVIELKPVPFSSAIDLRKNRRYLRFLLPPVFIIGALFFIAPSILTEGSFRLLNFNSEFEPKAPFSFSLQNDTLEVVEQSDFTLVLELNGEQLPAEVSVLAGEEKYRMEREDKRHFKYTIRKVARETRFRFLADGYSSKEFVLKVLPNPSLLSFEVQLDFPRYTGIASKRLSNSGDLTVPEGTSAKWIIKTRNAEQLLVRLPDSLLQLKASPKDQFSFSSRLSHSGSYALLTRNQFTAARDSLTYFLQVIPDQHPVIDVDEYQDSTSLRRKYFTGQVGDDYGFSRLTFHYRFVIGGDSIHGRELRTYELPVNRQLSSDRFVYFWDMSNLSISPGDQIEYYFVISDNDGIHGPKSTRSMTRVFKAPSLDEITANTDKNNSEIKDKMEKALQEAKKLSKDMKQTKQELLEKKNPGWQDQKKLQDILERHEELQKQLEDVKKQNEMNNQQKTEFREMNEALLEKQKQLEQLFDKLMNDEMKKLYEDLQKLMEQMNKDKVQEQMEKMEMSNEQLEKELDRSLELFKQMEVEQKMEEINDKLKELAEKQEQLSEESKDKKGNQPELEKKQEELNKEFEKVKEEMKKLEELNKELERPKDMPETAESQQKIDQEQKNSSEQLQQGKNKKASESQKNAAEEMKKMQQEMELSMGGSQSKQNEEDMNAIRALLENLITLSFDQEALMKEFAKTNPKDPRYVKLGQQQRKLKDDAKMIEDSLFALSKRQMAIQPMVNQELAQMNRNINESLNNIGERRTAQAMSNQQFTMTSLNNLALMLDQALQQMQQQQKNQGKGGGGGSCNNPNGQGSGQQKGNQPRSGKGSGKGQTPEQSVESIRKMQEELARTLERMKKEMEQKQQGKQEGGQQNGGNKPGKPGMGMPGENGSTSKELAEAAAKQEALRRRLLELSNELNKDGSGAGNGLKKIAEEMEKNEEDIVNMNINRQTIQRQQEIMTRLLESEKALRERDLDEKRESTESKNQDFSNSFQFLEYKRQKEKEIELLRTVPPALAPYYRGRVNEYFNIIEK